MRQPTTTRQEMPRSPIYTDLSQFHSKKMERIEQWKQQLQMQEMKECKFQPEVNHAGPIKSAQRTLNQFLKSQKDHQVKVQLKKTQISMELNAKESKENTFKPKINSESSVKNQAFQRLYQPTKHEAAQNMNQKCAFTPKIHKRSAAMNRDQPVETLLYQDAMRRQQKKTIAIQPLAKSTNSAKNDIIVAQKFIKRYAEILRKLKLFDKKKLAAIQLTCILLEMNYLRSDSDGYLNLIQLEQELLKQATNLLHNVGPNPRNLGVFLLALEGIFNVDIPEFTASPDQEDLCFDTAEGRKVQNYFNLLYRNKLSSVGEDRGCNQPPSPTFTPLVSPTSTEMARKYRQRMLQHVQKACNSSQMAQFHFDSNSVPLQELLMLHDMTKNMKLEATRLHRNDKEDIECTFQPNKTTNALPNGSKRAAIKCQQLYQRAPVGTKLNKSQNMKSSNPQQQITRTPRSVKMSEPIKSLLDIKSVDKTLFRMVEARQRKDQLANNISSTKRDCHTPRQRTETSRLHTEHSNTGRETVQVIDVQISEIDCRP